MKQSPKIFLIAAVVFSLLASAAVPAFACNSCCCAQKGQDCADTGKGRVQEPMGGCCSVESGLTPETATLNSTSEGSQAFQLAPCLDGPAYISPSYTRKGRMPVLAVRAFESPPIYVLTSTYLC